MANNFQNKTWFVTGATGLVGSTIISKLLETEANIIALLRKGTPQEKIDWFEEHNIKIFKVIDIIFENISTFKEELKSLLSKKFHIVNP